MRRLAVLAACWALVTGSVPARAARVPESDRSGASIARVASRLKQDLRKQGLTLGSPVYLRIFKEEKELEVWVEDRGRFVLFETLPVCDLGAGGLGPKLAQGDGMAPEGFYFVTPNQFDPASRFHLAFDLGYPNRYDLALGRTGGPQLVHGKCAAAGCFAMTDPGIERIWTLAAAALDAGQPFFRVHIFPFRMTPRNLERHRDSPWREFWDNLREGYDWFARHGQQPPNVTIAGQRYEFH